MSALGSIVPAELEGNAFADAPTSFAPQSIAVMTDAWHPQVRQLCVLYQLYSFFALTFSFLGPLGDAKLFESTHKRKSFARLLLTKSLRLIQARGSRAVKVDCRAWSGCL